MADINFFADTFGIQNLNGSGLGFYGPNFGRSVNVGEFQDTTFITDSNGTTEGPQVNNVKWSHPNSGEINGADSTNLQNIPNYLASLNIRFTHSTPVRTQNAKLRIFDRTNINNNPSGVTQRVAELIHDSTSQAVTGSGDTSWSEPIGSSVIMDLADSPGESGAFAGDGTVSTHDSERHDWYAALSASPDSIGSKLYALYVELEYL